VFEEGDRPGKMKGGQNRELEKGNRRKKRKKRTRIHDIAVSGGGVRHEKAKKSYAEKIPRRWGVGEMRL